MADILVSTQKKLYWLITVNGPYIYIYIWVLFFTHIPFMVNHTFNAALTSTRSITRTGAEIFPCKATCV